MPKDPVEDILQYKKSTKTSMAFKRFLLSVDDNGLREFWSIISLVVCWNTSTICKKKVIKELVLSGTDIDTYGTVGLNAIHILILKIILGKTAHDDLDVLSFLIRHGGNVRNKIFLNPNYGLGSLYYLPIDFIKHLQNAPDLEWKKLLPSFVAIGTNINQSQCDMLVRWFTLFNEGASNTEELSAFHLDHLTVRWKLPYPLKEEQILKRVHFLSKYQSSIENATVLEIRRTAYYNNIDEKYHIFTNPVFYDKNEFMPYEYVNYKDETGLMFHFHKSMVPSIFKSMCNPFTKKPIPLLVLNHWFDEMSQGPYIHDICTLRETLQTHSIFDNWFDDKSVDAAYYFVHGMILHSHPYSNFYDVKDYVLAQFYHVCTLISRPPFRLIKYTRIQHQKSVDAARMLFIQICMEYVMKTKNSVIHHLHFAIEDAIQDFRMTERIQVLCDTHGIDFNESNLFSACDMIDEVNDILLDRIGTFDEASYINTWNRLCSYKTMLGTSVY